MRSACTRPDPVAQAAVPLRTFTSVDSPCNAAGVVFDETQQGPAFPAEDLDSYIRDFEAGGFPVDEVVDVTCAQCRGAAFRLMVDEAAGAVRTCSYCGEEHFVVDSADHWAQADPAECACPCGGEEFSLAVGFARAENGEVRWVSVGARCLRDGSLGVYADWKIDYTPTAHLPTTV